MLLRRGVARIVDVDLEILPGEGRHRDLRCAVGGEQAMPLASRNDRECSGAQRERLGRSVVADDLQGGAAVEDVDELVAGEMTLPVILARGLDGEQQA